MPVTRLYQIEPFIDHLLSIHERFADGDGPADLPTGTAMHRVYLAEREATAALIDFYHVSTSGPLAATIEAVKRFARSEDRSFKEGPDHYGDQRESPRKGSGHGRRNYGA